MKELDVPEEFLEEPYVDTDEDDEDEEDEEFYDEDSDDNMEKEIKYYIG